MNTAYFQIKLNMKTLLATKLQRITLDLRKFTKDHLEKRKAMDKNTGKQDDNRVAHYDPSNPESIQRMAQIDAQTRYKDEEIIQLKKSMEEIAVIFKEFALSNRCFDKFITIPEN